MTQKAFEQSFHNIQRDIKRLSAKMDQLPPASTEKEVAKRHQFFDLAQAEKEISEIAELEDLGEMGPG